MVVTRRWVWLLYGYKHRVNKVHCNLRGSGYPCIFSWSTWWWLKTTTKNPHNQHFASLHTTCQLQGKHLVINMTPQMGSKGQHKNRHPPTNFFLVLPSSSFLPTFLPTMSKSFGIPQQSSWRCHNTKYFP